MADPPWDYSEGTGITFGDYEARIHRPSYSVMSVEEIKRLPVAGLAEADRWHINGDRGGSSLFLWTTTR